MFAFFFESVGGGEWLVLLAVILIVVGPKNLPAAARKLGKVMSQLRRAADDFKRQLMSMDEEMRKVGDDLKKEYVDVPAANDSSSSGVESSSTVEDYGEPYPGNMAYVNDDGTNYDDQLIDRAETEAAAATGGEAEMSTNREESAEPAKATAVPNRPIMSKRGFEPITAKADPGLETPKISISVSKRSGGEGLTA